MKKYTISEIADIMGVAPSAIRYYDSAGLLPDVEKVNGRRVFTDKDFAWLKVLNCLKSTGMPIKDIKEYVDLAKKGDSTLKERYEIVLRQKRKILDSIGALEQNLKIIEYKEWYYTTAIEAGTESIHACDEHKCSLEADEIPTKQGE